MSNYEQLFTELTPEEGATISGGYDYYIGNKSGEGVNYMINGEKTYLEPWQENYYSYTEAPYVVYDKKMGPGYEPTITKLAEGKNNFDRVGDDLILTTDLVANFVPSTPYPPAAY